MNETLTQLPSSTAWLLHLSTDIVIFTIRDKQMQVLLRQRYSETLKTSAWALPGGYIRPTEPLQDCAQRTLTQQTGVGDLYLEQLYTFGRPDRHPKSRVITVAYLAMIPFHQAHDVGRANQNIAWLGVNNLPELYLDHAEIIRKAHQRLMAKLGYTTIIFQLLPDAFTLSEVQTVYETILGEDLDKRNFRKRILSLDHIEETGDQRRNGSHRPARLYRYTTPGEIHYVK